MKEKTGSELSSKPKKPISLVTEMQFWVWVWGSRSSSCSSTDVNRDRQTDRQAPYYVFFYFSHSLPILITVTP